MYKKHLEAFVSVADAGSFTAAAAKRYVSRPALIQQMNLLEKQLGFRLFSRSPKGVVLTEAGQCFYNGAKQIMQISADVLNQCAAIEKTCRNTIRIGALPNFTPVVLPKICRVFTAQHPEIRIQFTEYPLEIYFKSFVNGLFDITTEYMSGYMFDQPGYQFVKLLEDKHCCGVPHAHPLARQKRIAFRDLRGKKLVLYAKGITRADDRLREYLERNEPTVELIDIQTYNSSLAIKCELEGCVLLYYSLYWQSFPTLLSIPVEWDLPIDIGLGYRTGAKPSVVVFINQVKKMYANVCG